ncbi:MAG: FHA domain-containing protein [Planctomycetaceae bacterium]
MRSPAGADSAASRRLVPFPSRAPSTAMAARLVSLTDAPSIPIDKPVIFIGRDSECDVVLSDSRRVSRKHCCLAHVNNRLMVRDLGSMNGVWINGERIERTGTMQPGDELAIGDVRYRLSTQDNSDSQAHPDLPEANPVEANPVEASLEFPVAVADPGDDVLVAEALSETDSSELLIVPGAALDDDNGDVIPLDQNGNYNDDDSNILPLPGR